MEILNDCLNNECMSSNELEVLMRQIMREVEKFYNDTTAKMLLHDGKIAELCNYVKLNLSNSIRNLLDTMKDNGELSDIITDTIINRISSVEDTLNSTLENTINSVNKLLEESKVYYDDITTIKKRDTLSDTDYYITKIPKLDKKGNLIKVNLGIANDSKTGIGVESTLKFAHRKNATLVVNAGIFDIPTSTPISILIKDGVVLSNKTLTDSKYQYLAFDDDNNFKVYPYDTTSYKMLSDGYKNALCIFGPLIVDGTLVEQTDERVEPRQAIGFTENNEIFIISCDGRTTANTGMSYSDLARIFAELGCINAHILDGGGSTSTVLRGVKQNDNIDNNYVDREVNTFLYIVKDNAVDVNNNLANELGRVKQSLIEDLINLTFPRGWTRLSGPPGYFAPGIEMCVNGEEVRRSKIGLSIDDNNKRNSYLYMSLKPTKEDPEKTNLFRIYEHGVWIQTYHGPSSSRPNGNGLVGLCYFDESINKPIWYDGTKWVDVNGQAV